MASEEEFVFSSCTFVFSDNVFAHDKLLWEGIIRLGFSMKLVESHVTVKKKSAPARDIEKLLEMISDALKPEIECDSQQFYAAQDLRRGQIEELEERREIGEIGQRQKIREDKFYTNKVAKGHVKEPETKLNGEPINAISKVNLQQKADLQKQYDELVYSKCWSPEEQTNEFDETPEASNTVVIRNMPHASPAIPLQKSRREDTLSHNAQSGHHDDSQEISLDADSGNIFCDAQFENENECGALAEQIECFKEKEQATGECGALAEQIECFKEKEQATGGASRSPGKTKRECGICFQDNAIPDSSSCCKGDLCQACKEKCPFCPFCRTPFKCITGNQPEGSMTITYSKTIQLRGFEGKDSYEIKYSFPSGRQGVRMVAD
ncbi:E3 ubiquitin-protein ligase dtx3l [Plakobranchus ocellatus]|uniref:E3 ubiquitin-protein ligase n=1 Tax=Plakobranchus ocellatus TaxID=259542 RepID=A0AAV3XUG6_9GAST|nr:E3 ubiquitin-protein ligase dtx3l [Plakobranchus ocellatus]